MLPNALHRHIRCIRQNTLVFPIDKLKLPLAITLGLRSGLSLWIGLIWIIVDRYHPADPEIINLAYGHLEVPENLLARAYLHAWVRWDAVHFLNIAKVTYSNLGQGDYNYFPLYPWLIRLFSCDGIFDLTWVALFVSTLSAFLALIIFRDLALIVFQDERLANWTIFTWAIFPTSFFLFAPYSDALFAIFSLGCLLALRKKHWITSGLLAILAGLTRGQGLLLVIPLGVQFIIDLFEQKKLNFRALAGVFMAPLGSLAYLFWRTQRAGMLFDGYARHSRRMIVDPLSAFIHALQQAAAIDPWQSIADVIAIVIFGLLILYAFRIPKIRKEVAFLSYAFVTFGSFLPWYSEVVSSYQSSTRYVLSLYPAFLVLAYLLVKCDPRLQKFYVTVSLALLLLASAGYTLWIFVG